jgi:glycosyltransferase involved in cell wall biosynthesis
MTGDTVGGMWTYILELTRAIPDVEFVVATMGRQPTADQLGALTSNVHVEASVFRLEWMEDPWLDVIAAAEWLLELESRHSPDVIHINGYVHAAVPFRAPKFVVAHSCVLCRWRAVGKDVPPPDWRTYRSKVELGLRAARLVVAPSAATLEQLDHHYIFDTPRRVIHHGRRLACSGHAAAGERQNVFAAGRLWDEAKNIKSVMEAAPRIAWPVVVAGDGDPGSDDVSYAGRLDAEHMCQQFSAAGIYLFPALYEPFGLSILEAAQNGCALVLGDIASLRELWGDAAMFVPPRDPSAIAETVNSLIHDHARRAGMAERAMRHALRYTPQKMAAAYRRTYEELGRPERRIVTGTHSPERRRRYDASS